MNDWDNSQGPSPHSSTQNGWHNIHDRIKALEWRVWEMGQRILFIGQDNRDLRQETQRLDGRINEEREARNKLVLSVLYVLVAALGAAVFSKLWAKT